MGKSNHQADIKSKITSQDVSRIQASEAKKNNGKVEKGSFTSRAQRVVEKNKKK